jgi:hypothetical protein
MSYPKEGKYTFFYHAYALAAGGWVKPQGGEFTPLESVAPSVLSITGGYGSASAFNVNSSAGRTPFGPGGPKQFFVHIGHAYTEVRGMEVDDEVDPMGVYKTTVRSVLDDFRINDIVSVEHAEAILVSIHTKPRGDRIEEGRVHVGRSDMEGLKVAGKKVKLTKHGDFDKIPTHGGLQEAMLQHKQALATATATAPAGKPSPDPWIDELCKFNDLDDDDEGAEKEMPQYIRDLTRKKSDNLLRLSLFKGVDAPGLATYKSSIEVKDFGRIFLGEVIVTHGTKQVNMLRFDLGCDNCGGYGGSGGTTNGTPMP